MTRFVRTTHRFLVASLLALSALASSAQAQDTAELSVSEVQLATALENGVAVSPATSFSRADGRIYAVIRLENPSSAATSVRVALEPVDGASRAGVSLDVPARRRYRTVARFSAGQRPGRYRCVVRTEDGRELASVELTVTE